MAAADDLALGPPPARSTTNRSGEAAQWRDLVPTRSRAGSFDTADTPPAVVANSTRLRATRQGLEFVLTDLLDALPSSLDLLGVERIRQRWHQRRQTLIPIERCALDVFAACGSGLTHELFELLRHRLSDQILTILEMPVERALRDTDLGADILDANGRNSPLEDYPSCCVEQTRSGVIVSMLVVSTIARTLAGHRP